MSNYLVIFRGDTNDADYIHNHEAVDKATLERLENIVNQLVNISRDSGGCVAHFPEQREFNWPTSEYKASDLFECYPDIDPEELEWLDEYMPHGEHGIHTGQVSFYIVLSEEKVLL